MTISRRTLALIISAIGIAAVAAIIIMLTASSGGSATNSTPATFAVSGTMDLGQCAGKGVNAYSDLQPGAQVEVTAQNGDVLGVGVLKPYTNPDNPNSCKRDFTVPSIPSGQALYGVHIGNAARGIIWKNEADARAGFEMSIG
jgi:hypothetical protein